ncbi:hypothetical protein [Paenibacillus xylanexedens]|uniref:hypothetical protein n=1 Tax=Paenibacillus xylanexedens TaxID=528191 RepID=UPI000F53797A|nr:hypothetical protein [Paenibacillus xylanexedens]RPK31745.1 hypothetical protein EDO6_02372 [Paenibacillus xylanexedens]
MQFNVILERRFAKNDAEEVEFLVNVDEEDCVEMAGDNDITIKEMQKVAVEYAIGRFFKQGYVMDAGDRLLVVDIEY